jgi:hypothetical protein
MHVAVYHRAPVIEKLAAALAGLVNVSLVFVLVPAFFIGPVSPLRSWASVCFS